MIEQKLFWKIFRREIWLVCSLIILLSTISFYISKSNVKTTIAKTMESSISSLFKTTIKENKYDEICEKISSDIHFLLIFLDNRKLTCYSDTFKKFSQKDLFNVFTKLKIGEANNIYNRRINREDFYHYLNISNDKKSISIYIIQDSSLLQNQLAHYRYNIIALTALVLVIIISFYISYSLRVSKPISGILSHVYDLNNPTIRQDLLKKIESTSLNEIELIESGFEKERLASQSLTEVLHLESNKFKSLLNSFSDPIMAIDLMGNILFSNQSFSKEFVDNNDETVGQFYLDHLRNYEIKTQFERILKSLNTNTISFEASITNLKEQKKSYLVKVDQLLNAEQKTYGYVVIFNDITIVKEAENIRIEFVGNVSHEVRTPLTSIKGYVQTLESIIKNDEYKEIFSTVTSNCDRLTNLFNDLLSLSSIETKQDIDFTDVHPKSITEQIISNYKKLYQETNIIVETEFACDVIYTNIYLLENIISNLIGNCFKYIDKNGSIKISWIEESDLVEFRISDNGPGIPENDLPRLFERFYRVDKSRTRSPNSPGYQGSGLGLAIVKSSVSKLGGKIKVKSKENYGTSFIIQLPKNS